MIRTGLTAALAVLGTVLLLPHPASQMAAGSGGVPPIVYANPRYQILTVNLGTAREDSVLLDTESGCTWKWADFKEGNQVWDFHPFDSDVNNPAGSSAQEQVACDKVLLGTIANAQAATAR